MPGTLDASVSDELPLVERAPGMHAGSRERINRRVLSNKNDRNLAGSHPFGLIRDQFGETSDVGPFADIRFERCVIDTNSPDIREMAAQIAGKRNHSESCCAQPDSSPPVAVPPCCPRDRLQQ